MILVEKREKISFIERIFGMRIHKKVANNIRSTIVSYLAISISVMYFSDVITSNSSPPVANSDMSVIPSLIKR